MSTRNKVTRQEFWLEKKKLQGREAIKTRKERRREEDKNPELRAERLARNKTITLEDKRIWPVSDDDWRRKRRRVEAGGEKKEEEKEKDDAERKDRANEDDADDKNEKAASDDDDIASMLDGESDSELEEAKREAQKQKEKSASTENSREAMEDAMADQYAALLPELAVAGEDGAPVVPKILVTTSRHATIHRQAQTLAEMFPNSTYIRRSGHRFVDHEYSIGEIAGFAAKRGFTALMVVNEDQKRPSGLDVALLPQGPMLHFSIQTWIDGRRLPNHGRPTAHTPELLLNNFVTPLGRLVGAVLGRLFPTNPEVVGRQVVTMHNQRDFVFVRRHRYAVREKRATERSVVAADGQGPLAGMEDVRVALQEIGPRLTLKLRRVDKGIARRSGQAFEWKGRMDKKRTLWQL